MYCQCIVIVRNILKHNINTTWRLTPDLYGIYTKTTNNANKLLPYCLTFFRGGKLEIQIIVICIQTKWPFRIKNDIEMTAEVMGSVNRTRKGKVPPKWAENVMFHYFGECWSTWGLLKATSRSDEKSQIAAAF